MSDDKHQTCENCFFYSEAFAIHYESDFEEDVTGKIGYCAKLLQDRNPFEPICEKFKVDDEVSAIEEEFKFENKIINEALEEALNVKQILKLGTFLFSDSDLKKGKKILESKYWDIYEVLGKNNKLVGGLLQDKKTYDGLLDQVKKRMRLDKQVWW